ncbi:MerR family transcriptional regulator [Candidatus Babeliales bacterium]|nr:MerR family transcriptional regulator [Candidatus Babeliales bacterium]
MLMQNKKESKKKLKISELSDLLKVKKSTIKLWERELNLDTVLSHLYSDKEILLFKKIKQLLQHESFSMKQVRETLEASIDENRQKEDSFTPAQSTDEVNDEKKPNILNEPIISKLAESPLEQQAPHQTDTMTPKDCNTIDNSLLSAKYQQTQESIKLIKSGLLSIKNRLD